MAQFNLFEETFQNLVHGKVGLALIENSNELENLPVEEVEQIEEPQQGNRLFCSHCRITFSDVAEQREHYKLEWHRHNLKQGLSGKEAVTEEQFNEGNYEDSSFTESESEDEDDRLKTITTSQGKLYLKTESGKIVSIYKCLLANKKDDVDEGTLSAQLTRLRTNNAWTVLMLGGGHFAGAVFRGATPVLHKTFHSYTVRAGQGKSQSNMDNSGGCAKSAGSALRRYNEQTFTQHVTELLENWKADIAASNLIVVRAAGQFNKTVLFGGKTAVLERADSRIRIIPFSTKRPTFTEVKRVHSVLSTVNVYDSHDSWRGHIVKLLSPRRAKVKNPSINRAKSREIVERPIPTEIVSSDESEAAHPENQFVKSESEVEYEVEQVEINFREELTPFGGTRAPKKKKEAKKGNSKKSKQQEAQELENKRKKELFDVVIAGNLEKLKEILVMAKLDEVIDDEGNMALHVASLNEHEELVKYLLENGANVCARNTKNQTAYSCMKHQSIREIFKTFAKDNPDKYDYNKAHIPLPNPELNPEEIAERKKAQKKLKREKEKIKKKEKESEKREHAEMERFANLSDREKRALAAERRIISNSGSITSRCFLCGGDMAGKVPFEYMQNRFCTIECLKAHRMKNPVVLS